MKKILLFLFIFLISNVLATCGEGQIDINSASAEELDKIVNIGPKIAIRVIDARPFSSVDDLIRVSGIGNITLNEIKQQNLACVSGEEENAPEEEDVEEEETQKEEEEAIKEEISNDEEPEKVESIIKENSSITGQEIRTIVLNPKDIKSESDKEQLNKNKLAIYTLIIFCILLVLLFGFKKRRTEKNEFK